MRLLRDKLRVEKIHVVAHSMGNFLVLNALRREPQQTGSLAELILAAPDVDRDFFKQVLPEVRHMFAGATLYASSADKALVGSRELARGIPRAGDVPADGPVLLDGVDTIDVTAIGDELLGVNHDVFATNRSLIDDIGLLLDGLHHQQGGCGKFGLFLKIRRLRNTGNSCHDRGTGRGSIGDTVERS